MQTGVKICLNVHVKKCHLFQKYDTWELEILCANRYMCPCHVCKFMLIQAFLSTKNDFSFTDIILIFFTQFAH